jgi:hypothetical protein
VSVLELDRVLDTSPDDLDSHRLGLATARQNRLELMGRSTARLLTQMDETVRKANAKVLFNPFDSPAAVRSSNVIARSLVDFRGRLGIHSGHESTDAKGWGEAAGEVMETVLGSSAEHAATAKRFGDEVFERVSGPFRSVDLDGDGIPDQARAAAAAEQAGATIKAAAGGVSGAFGSLFQRKGDATTSTEQADSRAADGVD